MDDGQPRRVERFRVTMGDTDAAQIIYYGAPLRWAERLVTGHLADSATSISTLFAEGHGLPAVETTVRYHRPLRLDDPVRGELLVQHRSTRSITWHCGFYPAETHTLAVEVVLTQVCIRLADATPAAVALPDRLDRCLARPPLEST